MPSQRAEAVAAIYEGYRLHYENGSGDQGKTASDDERNPNLSLLDGDRLYADGLSKLADLGDLQAVALLADTISEAVQAQVEDRQQDAHDVWRKTLDCDLSIS